MSNAQINWDSIDLPDLAAPATAPKAAASRQEKNPTVAIDPARLNWDALQLDDLTPAGAADYGNGARGWAGPNSGERSPDGAAPEIYTAGKRDLGEKMGAYEELNRGLGGNYNPLTHGATLGSSDEILSGMMAPFEAGLNYMTGEGPTALGEAYDQQKAAFLRDKALYEEQYPYRALAGEIGGSLIGGGPKAFQWVTELPKLGQRVAAGSALGAAAAGTYSAMDTEGTLEDRLRAGGEGARIGAVAGAFGPAAEAGLMATGRGIGSGTRAVRDFFAPATTRAERDFVKAATADRVAAARAGVTDMDKRGWMTEEQLTRADDAWQSPSAADMGGDRLRSTIKNAVQGDADAAGVFENMAKARQQAASENAAEGVAEIVMPGSTRGGNAAQELDALRKAAGQLNQKAYREAFAAPEAQFVMTDRIRRLSADEAVQRAIADAVKEHAADRLTKGLPNDAPVFSRGADGLLDLDGAGGKPSLEFWDRVGKRLRDQAENARGPNGKATYQTSRLNDFRNQLLDEIDNVTRRPGEAQSLYGRARSNAKDFFGFEDAYEAGLDGFKRSSVLDESETFEAVQKMAPIDRALYARGYSQALVEELASTSDVGNVERILNNAGARRRLNLALGEDQAKAVREYLQRESLIRVTNQMAIQAAKTARNSEMLKQLAGVGAAEGGGAILGAMIAGGNIASFEALLGIAAGSLARSKFRKMSASRQKAYAKAMAELATTRDGDKVRDLFRRINADPEFSRLSQKIATYGLANTPPAGFGEIMRRLPVTVIAEGPGAVAPVMAANTVEPTRLSPEDVEARAPEGGGSQREVLPRGSLLAPGAYARGGLVESLSPSDRELVERRAAANKTTVEAEHQKLMAARRLLDEADEVQNFARGGLVTPLDRPSGNPRGGEPRGLRNHGGGEPGVSGLSKGTSGHTKFSQPGGGMGTVQMSRNMGGASTPPKAIRSGGSEPQPTYRGGGGEVSVRGNSNGGEPNVTYKASATPGSGSFDKSGKPSAISRVHKASVPTGGIMSASSSPQGPDNFTPAPLQPDVPQMPTLHPSLMRNMPPELADLVRRLMMQQRMQMRQEEPQKFAKGGRVSPMPGYGIRADEEPQTLAEWLGSPLDRSPLDLNAIDVAALDMRARFDAPESANVRLADGSGTFVVGKGPKLPPKPYRDGGIVSEPAAKGRRKGKSEQSSTRSGKAEEASLEASVGQGEASGGPEFDSMSKPASPRKVKATPASTRRASSTTAPSRMRQRPERIGRSQPAPDMREEFRIGLLEGIIAQLKANGRSDAEIAALFAPDDAPPELS